EDSDLLLSYTNEDRQFQWVSLIGAVARRGSPDRVETNACLPAYPRFSRALADDALLDILKRSARCEFRPSNRSSFGIAGASSRTAPLRSRQARRAVARRCAGLHRETGSPARAARNAWSAHRASRTARTPACSRAAWIRRTGSAAA